MKKQTFLLIKGERVEADGALRTVEAVETCYDRHYGRVVVVHFADQTRREYLMKELVEVLPALKEGATL